MTTDLKDDDPFTDQQIMDLREAFDLFDTDKDGYINTQELHTVMRRLRQDATEEQIKEMINQVDIDGNNLVDFDEFVLMMQTRQEAPSEDSEMRAYFRCLDKDGNGYIDAQELKRTMQELGLPLTDRDLQSMMKEAGCDINGRIYYEDFVRIMTGDIGKCQKRMSKLSVPRGSADFDQASLIEDDEYRDLQVAFAMFDKDGDGSITTHELREVMKSLNIDINNKDARRLIKKIDKDGNGRVEFDEFRAVMTRSKLLPPSPTHRKGINTQQEEFRQAFKIFDKNNRGYIDGENLRETMKQLGVVLNEADIRAMLKTAGVKAGGKIFYEDFVNIMFGQFVKPLPKDGTISSQQIQEMKVAFALFDHDGDGSVTPAELRTVMKHLGYTHDDELVKKMISRFDHDGNGTLEYDEFARMLTGLNKDGVTRWDQADGAKSPEPESWRAFKIFDIDHNGYISPAELRSTMAELGICLSDEDVALMMRLADTDGDGLINYQEFKKLMEGKFQGLLGCAQNGDHVANGSVAPKTGSSPSKKTPTSTSTNPSGSNSGGGVSSNNPQQQGGNRHAGVSHSPMSDSNRRMSRNSPPVPPRKNPPPPPPPRAGHPRWHSMKENNSSSNNSCSDSTNTSRMNGRGLSTAGCGVDAARRASDSKAYIATQHHHHQTVDGSYATSPSPRQRRKTTCGEVGRPRDLTGSSVTSLDAPTVSSSETDRQMSVDGDDERMEFIPLSPEYEQILRESFKLFDLNNDGFIQASELGLTMRKLGLSYTAEQLNVMVSKCDPMGNGIVDFEEFLRMMSRSRHRSRSDTYRKQCEEDEMRQAFKVFDIDGNGYIDADELKLTMQNLGETLTAADVQAMIKEADTNGDGMIDYEEFIRMMSQRGKK